jgi:proline racemase
MGATVLGAKVPGAKCYSFIPMLTLKTIDAHAAGEPLRLIVDGFPSPRGKTMLEKRAWVSRHADHLRRALMLEPRGHADMYGAILTEPVTPGSHAGVLFMHNEGYSTMCGHGVIAVTTIALERGLIMPGQDGGAVVYDSPAGTIRARARWAGEAGLPTDLSAVARGAKVEARSAKVGGVGQTTAAARVAGVSFVNVPSFVLHGGLSVKLASRQIRVDVAFGGAFYAIVDSEAVGLPIDAAHLPELRRAGMEIKDAIESVHDITHPLERGLQGIYGTIFTGPPSDEGADLRNVTVFADAEVDRSPCGTGTAAVMAVVEAMGLLSDTKPFVHESLIGTRFSGRVSARTVVGELEAIVPEIEGSAWITGEHTFLVDDDDPLKNGFRI